MPRHLISDTHEWMNDIPIDTTTPAALPAAPQPVPYLLSSETTAKGTGLAESAGKEDPVELDSSLAR